MALIVDPGPPHARPLQLELGEGNQEETRGEEVTIDKGKGKANGLKRS